MSQHDYTIDNALMPTARADINLALKALASMNEGATEPATTFASQVWVDTTANILKLRNKANTAWISVADIDASNDRMQFIANIFTAASTAGITFKASGGATILTASNTGLITTGAGGLALGGKLDTNAKVIQESIGTAQASAATVTPPTDGNAFHITGTTAVTGFTNGSVGQSYTVTADAALPLTNSSTFVVEGGTRTLAAGDTFMIRQDTATVWRAWGFPAPSSPFIISSVASASASLIFTDFDATKYGGYEWDFSNLIPSVDQSALLVQFSTDGGSTWDATSGNYVWWSYGRIMTGSAVFSASGTAGDSNISISLSASSTSSIGAAAGEYGMSGTLKMHGPDLTGSTKVLFDYSYERAAGGEFAGDGSGTYRPTTAVNAIKFFMSSGNIASGEITMFGKAKT